MRINIIIILMRQLYKTPLQRSRGRYQASSRNYVSDIGGNSLKIDRIRNKNLNGDRLRLVQVDNPQAVSRITKKNRAHSYYQKQPQEEEFSKIRSDVLKLQQEILARKNRLENRGNQILPLSRFRTRTIPQQIQVPRDSYQLRRRFLQNQGKIQQLDKQLSPSTKKKLYKIKKRHRKFLFEDDQEQSSAHSFVDNINISRSRKRNRQDLWEYQRPVIYKVRHPPTISRIFRSSKNAHRFRRAANVILFIIRLRTYNQRMRIRRFDIFQKYLKGELNQKLLQLKNELVLCSKPLFLSLADQQNFNYRLHEKDEPILKKQKINSVCKLVSLELKYLQKFINQVATRQTFTQLIYVLCKHGNYTCTEELNTSEELNLTSISEVYGYVRADKYLEQSAIISLVFIKILLYNIFLQPERIDMIVNQQINLKVVYSNLKLIGNVLYELFIDIQDELLEKAPQFYTVGNWNVLKNIFRFKIAQSMTIRPGFFQKNELISGLASNKFIRDIYGTKSMKEQRHILKLAIKKLHQNIVNYHQKFRQESFIR